MSLQDAIAAGYRPVAAIASKKCRACAQARPSKAADTLLVCRRHECTVHRDGSCRFYQVRKP